MGRTYTIAVGVDFCAGHRLFKHEGKCKHVHGHNYRATITARAQELDRMGMVIDFSEIKNSLREFIDRNWDHAMILMMEDPICSVWTVGALQGHKLYTMNMNPTAENMAQHLLNMIQDEFRDKPIDIIGCKIQETPDCVAEAISDK